MFFFSKKKKGIHSDSMRFQLSEADQGVFDKVFKITGEIVQYSVCQTYHSPCEWEDGVQKKFLEWFTPSSQKDISAMSGVQRADAIKRALRETSSSFEEHSSDNESSSTSYGESTILQSLRAINRALTQPEAFDVTFTNLLAEHENTARACYDDLGTIYLDKAFFSSGPGLSYSRQAGVLVHEISHAVAGTRDPEFEGTFRDSAEYKSPPSEQQRSLSKKAVISSTAASSLATSYEYFCTQCHDA